MESVNVFQGHPTFEVKKNDTFEVKNMFSLFRYFFEAKKSDFQEYIQLQKPTANDIAFGPSWQNHIATVSGRVMYGDLVFVETLLGKIA